MEEIKDKFGREMKLFTLNMDNYGRPVKDASLAELKKYYDFDELDYETIETAGLSTRSRDWAPLNGKVVVKIHPLLLKGFSKRQLEEFADDINLEPSQSYTHKYDDDSKNYIYLEMVDFKVHPPEASFLINIQLKVVGVSEDNRSKGGPEIPSGMITQRSLAASLDKIADKLEAKGNFRLALAIDRVSDKLEREALDPSVQAPGQATNRVSPDTVAKAIGLQGWDDVRKPSGAHEGTMVSPNQKLSEVPALVGKIKPMINNAVDYANTYIDKKLVPDKSAFNNLSIRLPSEGADGMYYWESKNLDLFTGLITRLLTLPELKNATTGCVAGLVMKRGYLSPIDSIYLCGKPRVG